ncbi:UBX domain-containing protein 1 [Thrips palmi]|uniref:UBX domain-containing protein 1 n=1 Tax=Thrips palmi TaxID=161013 RepID=A0A6P8ZA54_THRPL|nr:UBX domain-containing protein 1 [Thrips palmi]
MSSADVDMLIDMGFLREKAEKALQMTGNKGVEPAMEWLLAHNDDVESSSSGAAASSNANGEEAASAETAEAEAKSLKCNECNKLFKTQSEVEFHAAKTGHTDFAESTEEKKPLTEEEKAEQVRKLEEKLKMKRKEREEKEKLEALEKEKNRIRSGKEMIEAKRKLEEQEIKKMAELRRREKEDDKRARDRVRAQIEADKAARKAKADAAAGITPVTPAPAPVPVQVKPATPSAPKDYSETRLQIRLTNGQALTQTFGAKETLSAVRVYIEMNRTDGDAPFSLMTSFPRKVFAFEDYEKPLEILGLVPSSVLIVAKAQ